MRVANYRRPLRKCLTTVGGGATVGSSCRLQFAAPSTSPGVEHVRIGGLRPRFVPHFSNHLLVLCSCDVTSAKPMTESDCASASGQAQIRLCKHHRNYRAATAIRLSDVDASGTAHSAPISLRKNDDIDAQNGQAYHGRKTTTTNGTRSAVLGARSCEGQRTQRQRRGLVASHVRSRLGATGCAGVFRAGSQATISNDSVRLTP